MMTLVLSSIIIQAAAPASVGLSVHLQSGSEVTVLLGQGLSCLGIWGFFSPILYSIQISPHLL